MLKDLIKKQYKNLILISVYIISAALVYGIWFNSMWHLWYVNLITVVVIVAIGCVIGYFYLKLEIKNQDEANKKDITESVVEEAEVTVEEVKIEE